MMKETVQKFENKETFDFDEFLANNQINNIALLERFFKDIYREISNQKEGINIKTFREFINLPSYISDKIFQVFDKNNLKFLNLTDYLKGMIGLYNGDFFQLTKFIFDFFDFDKDGKIIYEDVMQIQLLILPSEHHTEEVFNSINESLDSFFEDYRYMDYDNFVHITENFNSDIFMNLIVYLYMNKPFSNEIISHYYSDKRLSGVININNKQVNSNGLKKTNTDYFSQDKRSSYSISTQYDPLLYLNPRNYSPEFGSKQVLSGKITNYNQIKFRDSENYIEEKKLLNQNDGNQSNHNYNDRFNILDLDLNTKNKNKKFANIDDNENDKISFPEANFKSLNINNKNQNLNQISKNIIKTPRNNLFLKRISENYFRMVTYTEPQHYEDVQNIIKEETTELKFSENDLDFEEVEEFIEPVADEKFEKQPTIRLPQMPSIKNLFEIFKKKKTNKKEYEESKVLEEENKKRSITDDAISRIKSKKSNFLDKINSESILLEKLLITQEPNYQIVPNINGSSNFTAATNPKTSTQNIVKNSSLNNNDLNTSDIKKLHPDSNLTNKVNLNNQLNSSKKKNSTTNGSENLLKIEENIDKNNSNNSNNSNLNLSNPQASNNNYDNKIHSNPRNKKKVIKKFYRSYTFNFEKSNFEGSSHYSNINKAEFSRKNSNDNYLRKDSDFARNNYSPSCHGSQNDCFINEESLRLKQSQKFTYEAFINKYNEKKDKIIRYYIVLNNKMMLYFKNDCKTKFRGLHYLSDAYSTVRYDKTENIISGCIKYNYLNLTIKGSVKWFVSKNDFEMRKWFEVLKKTINPHKSRQLKDYYILKETICEGKYGVVKRCINKKSKQEVSIKLINMKNLGDPKKTELIFKEIEILRHCNHRSILKYIDHFIENNPEQNRSYIYIVMEYLNGGDLANFINRKGCLHESKVLSIAWDIAKGLEYLHKLGIVHRDIKPENIVFDNLQKPRIVDFGLSQIISFNEFLEESYGTYFYASPEIHNKMKYNKATDIWSFGILLYYILTGDLPFDRNRDEANLIICDQDNEFLFDNNINFYNASTSLKDLIKSCLKKNMNERLTIERVINHEAFQKYNSVKI